MMISKHSRALLGLNAAVTAWNSCQLHRFSRHNVSAFDCLKLSIPTGGKQGKEMPQPTRMAMQQSIDVKDCASGVVIDPLPVQLSVPRQDLYPSKHERLLYKGSSVFRKKTRRPTVDLRDNPACEARQITDSYEMMRMNRNPALYRPTKADAARSTKLLDDHEKALANSDVNAVKLRYLEEAGAFSAALQVRRGLNDGNIRIASLDEHLPSESIPHFETFNSASSSDGHQPTYGHPHKPRIFNPLTNDLTRASKLQSGHSSGLTVAQLKGLLRRPAVSDEKHVKLAAAEPGLPFNYDTNPVATKPTWDDSFAVPSVLLKAQTPLPHPGVSELDRFGFGYL